MTLRSTLTAAIAALAIAVSGFAAPAAAKPDRDLVRLLAGAAAVAVVVGALDHDRREQRVEQRYYQPRHYQPRRGTPYVYHEQGYGRPAYRPQRVPALPSSCVLRAAGSYDAYYSGPCLYNAGLGRYLPEACAEFARSPNGWHRVFGANCLTRAGLRPERHGRRW